MQEQNIFTRMLKIKACFHDSHSAVHCSSYCQQHGHLEPSTYPLFGKFECSLLSLHLQQFNHPLLVGRKTAHLSHKIPHKLHPLAQVLKERSNSINSPPYMCWKTSTSALLHSSGHLSTSLPLVFWQVWAFVEVR